MLKDVLQPNLRLVVCGSAAGRRSAELGQYYAGPGNKFWTTLAVTGLTPRKLAPAEADLLPSFGIGLTDVVKGQSGSDIGIDFSRSDVPALEAKLVHFAPALLCFNGKRAAQVFLGVRDVGFGLQPQVAGRTRLFIAPSTSGAANGTWDLRPWEELAALAKAAG